MLKDAPVTSFNVPCHQAVKSYMGYLNPLLFRQVAPKLNTETCCPGKPANPRFPSAGRK